MKKEVPLLARGRPPRWFRRNWVRYHVGDGSGKGLLYAWRTYYGRKKPGRRVKHVVVRPSASIPVGRTGCDEARAVRQRFSWFSKVLSVFRRGGIPR